MWLNWPACMWSHLLLFHSANAKVLHTKIIFAIEIFMIPVKKKYNFDIAQLDSQHKVPFEFYIFRALPGFSRVRGGGEGEGGK